jgi:hypothetical protein
VRRKLPVSATCLGGGSDSVTCVELSSSISSPEKEKLKDILICDNFVVLPIHLGRRKNFSGSQIVPRLDDGFGVGS